LKQIEKINDILHHLRFVENFYSKIGGVLGYHYTVFNLLEEQKKPIKQNIKFLVPPSIDIRELTKEVRSYVDEGLKNLPIMAEIYPMGGVGDRLGLVDEKTNEPLSVANLPFAGKNLFSSLIRDIQAREYLYYKKYNKQIITPLVIMTSYEKNNYLHVQKILDDANYFNRPKDSFFIMQQPSVPILTEEGQWLLDDSGKLNVKPGGHGTLWKMMLDKKAFDWLYKKGRKKAIVRQINNPLAGTDYGLLAFYGYGVATNKSFGFSACPRKVGAAEGMDILTEMKSDNAYEYGISNIEYTDFIKYNIEDIPIEEGSSFSLFPSNTNILFVDLPTIEKTTVNNPLPSLIINMKNTISVPLANGKTKEVRKGRLELMMQGVADFLKDSKKQQLDKTDFNSLKTYLTYNERTKTISTTKRFYVPGKTLKETPEECYYDLLYNYHEILTKYCNFSIPDFPSEEEYLKNGPNIIAFFHPSLGPMYEIIAKKIKNGKISYGSELQLEISDITINNLNLDGSLLILSDQVLGKVDIDKNQFYNDLCGKCKLKEISVANKGIKKSKELSYWKNDFSRHEATIIELKGNAEFIAEGVTFSGSHQIKVEDGFRLQAYQENGKIIYNQESI
jgi:hypothetical protein